MAQPPQIKQSKLLVPPPEDRPLPESKPRSTSTLSRLAERTSITVTVDIKVHLIISVLTALILAVVAVLNA